MKSRIGRRYAAIVCACAGVVPAFGLSRTLTTHVPAAVAAGEARLVGPAPRGEVLQLAVSLPLRDEAGLDALLAQIYDPSSPNYRHYLSVAEFAAQFGPSQNDHDAVVQFAQAHGLTVSATRASRMAIDLAGTVENIEAAFNVHLNVYRHPVENRTFFAPDREPELDLAVPVLHVTGLDNYTLPRSKNIISGGAVAKAAGGSGPGGQFTGS